jgi:hypothetical protein
MSEAEEFYETETKKNEEEFLERLKKGETYEKVERDYTKKSIKTRKEFEKRYNKELKNFGKDKEKKKKKEEEDKEFLVEKIDLSQSQGQRMKRKASKKIFQIKRNYAKVTRTGLFNIFRYMYFRIKYYFKNIRTSINIIKEKIDKRIKKIGKGIKERFNKTKTLLKSIKSKISFKRKKKGKKKEGDGKKGTQKDTESKDKEKDSENK